MSKLRELGPAEYCRWLRRQTPVVLEIPGPPESVEVDAELADAIGTPAANTLVQATLHYAQDVLEASSKGIADYVRLAKNAERRGAHVAVIRDVSGALNPAAVTELVEAIRSAVDIPLRVVSDNIVVQYAAAMAEADVVDGGEALSDALKHTGRAPVHQAAGTPVLAPFAGTTTALVASGTAVSPGDRIAVLEAMKMEAAIVAPRAGIVRDIKTCQVNGGDRIAVIAGA